MAIPQSFIQELLARVDVVDVVGRYVQLKKGGANFMGLCPFHGEKSPSFSVSPAKQFYHCFGCGANGNAIGFLMEHAGMNFVEAVKDLAAQVGLQVPEDDVSPQERERAAQQRQKQATLTDVLEKAAKAYQKDLKASPRAVDYLKRRGLTGQIAKAFGLGYAPEGWRHLAGVFPDYSEPLLVESGLVIEHEDEKGQDGEARRYDRFRDRIMFPIRNVKGECIGFGGRVLDKGEPKYLNSPETPVFSKGRELYGLFEARTAIRQHGYALVTEGYMDVVALAQLGFANAVATLGTACTPDHVHKLFRFTDAVVFSFDGDAAGRRAARKALDAALPLATDTRSVKFLFLPPEHDPDSYIRAHGAQAFAAFVQQALPLSRFLVEAASADCDLATAEGRARLAGQAHPLWNALPDGALKRQLLGELAQNIGIGSADLQDLWQREDRLRRPREGRPSAGPQHGTTPAQAAAAPMVTPSSRMPAEGHHGNTSAAPAGHSAWSGAARGGWRRMPPPPPRMLGHQTASRSREDRSVGLLLANASAWDSLSADDHALLAHLPPPHGPVFAWFEALLHEHGPLPWAALREALRGQPFEAYVCAEVAQATVAADAEAERQELAGVMDLLRRDGLMRQSQALTEQALTDPVARLRLREINERIKALKPGQPV
ncbi:MAG: DNA primase [Hydrogenophaga sp.]